VKRLIMGVPLSTSGSRGSFIDGCRDAPVSTGQSDELGRLYEEHRDRLWRAVFAFCGDPDVAADAVAEAFAQALRRGNVLRDPLAWVWRAGFRIAAGELKARSRAHAPVHVGATYEMPEPASELISALRRLSPKQRGALVLRYYGGYTSSEIAQVIGSTPTAVRVHLAVGRRRLRELLGEGGDA
jgi:RNA polymerase sigma-70 factor (ECF subfamily)